MIGSLAHLLVGFVLSFIGSMPPGLINMSVAEATISRSRRSAALISLGAALVEAVQVLFAIKCASWFVAYPSMEQIIRCAAIPVFLGLGIFHLLQKEKTETKKTVNTHALDFWRGVLISSLNFLAIPFWLFYGTWLGTQGWLTSNLLIGTFTLGAFLGTMALLLMYGWLSLQIVQRLQEARRFTNRFLAVLFLGLGLWQLFTFL